MEICVNLDLMLLKRRMSLSELADRVGITLANLSILKTNKARAIRFSTLAALCRELSVSPRWRRFAASLNASRAICSSTEAIEPSRRFIGLDRSAAQIPEWAENALTNPDHRCKGQRKHAFGGLLCCAFAFGDDDNLHIPG